MSLQQEMQWHSGLCLIAVTTHDHVARAVALGLLGLTLAEATAEVADTCWAKHRDRLREAVADRFLPSEG